MTPNISVLCRRSRNNPVAASGVFYAQQFLSDPRRDSLSVRCKGGASWIFDNKTITAASMWPCAFEANKTIVYRCAVCGHEIVKSMDEMRCEESVSSGYACYSNGDFLWKCPEHGMHDLTVGHLGIDDEAFRLAAEEGYELCCAQDMLDRQKRMQSAETGGVAKCIVCNCTLPKDEMAAFPHTGSNDCSEKVLHICYNCWYDHSDFTLEDNCADSDLCDFDDQLDPSLFDDQDDPKFKRMAIQNVELDEDGYFSSFELICTKSGTVLSFVSCYQSCEDDFEFFDEE